MPPLRAGPKDGVMRITLRSVLEALMYLAFCAAAVPFAWQGMSELLYYRSHPEMLQTRDAATMVMGVVAALDITKPLLLLAVLLALFFLVRGPRAARFSSAGLLIAWILTIALGAFAKPGFVSVERLSWDAIPFVVLLLL